MTLNRREIFAALMAAAAARRGMAADDGVSIAGKRPMILHNPAVAVREDRVRLQVLRWEQGQLLLHT